MNFPESFLWGAAMAATQCEGAYLEGGKGLTVQDFVKGGGKDTPRMFKSRIEKNEFYPSHTAVDFYHHYEEDIRLMAEAGLKCYRMSISWARIFPNGDDDEPNENGLRFYQNIFELCHDYGIEPMVTLSHFDMPWEIAKKYGGFYNRKTIGLFVKYADTVMRRYKGQVQYWLTFNEINFGILEIGAYKSLGLIEKEDLKCNEWISLGNIKKDFQKQIQALHHQFVASALTVKIAHEIDTNNKVGCMIGYLTQYPLTSNPDDLQETQKKDRILNQFCGDVMVRGSYPTYIKSWLQERAVSVTMQKEDEKILREGTVDFYAFSYYMSNCTTVQKNVEQVNGNLMGGARNPYLAASAWGWQIDSKGLCYTINQLWDRYGIPLMIVENGLGAEDVLKQNQIHDDYRIDYLREHIQEIGNAVRDGASVMGYTMWSFLDLVSSGTGEMHKRYGLVYVDRHDDGTGDYRRIKKDSYYWYKKVIQSNGTDM